MSPRATAAYHRTTGSGSETRRLRAGSPAGIAQHPQGQGGEGPDHEAVADLIRIVGIALEDRQAAGIAHQVQGQSHPEAAIRVLLLGFSCPELKASLFAPPPRIGSFVSRRFSCTGSGQMGSSDGSPTQVALTLELGAPPGVSTKSSGSVPRPGTGYVPDSSEKVRRLSSRFLTAAEAAEVLGVPEARIRHLIETGQVEGAARVGGLWLVPATQDGRPKITPPPHSSPP